MAAVRHFEFEKFWDFVKKPTLEAQSAFAHQISLKSDDFRLRYGDKTIFKMAAVRHLKFEKFRFFLSNFHARNGNLYLCTKFDRNRNVIVHQFQISR